MGFLLPLAAEAATGNVIPDAVWGAVCVLLGAVALWFRRQAGAVGRDARYRALTLQLLEKILRASNKACCTLDCPWADGRIPDAWKREVENALLRMRLDKQGGHGHRGG